MSIGADGIKRGTNYIHRAELARRREATAGQIALALAQDVACTRGEHDATEARPGYTTWVGGRQVEPGTRYCRRCSLILETR